ncbi:EAL domain-containing protein [Pseudofrankia sp. BMG5.36]|uniref:EAL domain-containing protein n=1 Tax=Pseudofrankia sp. BMG5.36 TaxID=1834512 RepID=UPI0009F5919E|nr:EAL domain-containing protein [Pseudofrankia sp. BMG5.36]
MLGSGPVRERGFLAVLPLVGTLFLLLMLVLPMSQSYLRPETFAAFLISLATLCYILRAGRGHPGRRALVVTVAMTAAMTTAVLGSPSRTPLAFLAWYPWAGGYAGLVSRHVGRVAALTGAVCLTFTGALIARGDLDVFPLTYVAALLSIVASAMLTYGFFSWGRGRAFADPLTGLTNRAGLMHAGEPAITEALVAGRAQAVMVLDISRFREINSALGHQAGDEALREYADLLREVHPRPAFAGRLGGDEFVLVLPGEDQVSDRADPHGEWLARLGEKVLEQLDGPVRIRGINIELESTAGIASAPRDGDRLSRVLPCADAALANAKRDGARVGVWNAGMAGTVGVRSWELALHAQLRTAIAKGELVLYYQPVQEAATGRIAGAEALMRWCHPERGLLPPSSFLPMAERSSLIIGLTWWELEEVLAQSARWTRAGLHLPVSANLSARMLVIDDLPGKVARRLEHHGLPPEMLTLEITESALVSQPARAAAMLGELRAAGVKLSLDDFGTGYSSMENLKALPFDEMKIDKSFVADARGSLPDVAIVRSVVDLGHRLGLRVVGEGVEDEQSARMLTELGCDLLQGNVLSPPLPPEELEALLAVRQACVGAWRTSGSGPQSAASGEPSPTRPDTARADTGRADTARLAGLAKAGVTPSSNGHRAGEQASPAGAARSSDPAGPTGPTGPTTPSRRGGAGEDLGRAGRAREAGTHGPRPTVPEETIRTSERTGVVAPEPPDESSRLAALRQYRILDTPPEPEFDALATLAAQITDCDFSHLVFINSNREWPKACHGVQASELRAWVGPGSFIVADGHYLEIQDCSRDLRYAHLTRAEPKHVIFFAGAPLRTAEGHVLGALCVSDRVPRRLTTGQRTALDTLASHAVRLLDARLHRLLLAEATAGLERLETFWHRHDLPAAATLCADVVRGLTHADAVAVMLPELPGSTVFRAAGVSVVEGVPPLTELGVRTTSDDQKAISELAAATGPVFIPDAAAHPLIPNEMVRRLGIASALMMPLHGEGGVQGMITVRWTQHLARLDPAVRCAVTLFCGQARFTLAKLRAAQGQVAVPGLGSHDEAGCAAGDVPGRAMSGWGAPGAGGRAGGVPNSPPAGGGAPGGGPEGQAAAQADSLGRRRSRPATSRY